MMVARRAKKRRGFKLGAHQPPSTKPISLVPPPWDMGAEGPANQDGLTTEPATEIDPETGRETPNPNGVTRRRRDGWIDRYWRRGLLTIDQRNIARELRNAAEGKRDRDPLAALSIDSQVRSDPEAARVDARRKFRAMRALIPQASWPIIERVAIEDRPIWAHGGRQTARHLDRLRDGLEALHEAWTRGSRG